MFLTGLCKKSREVCPKFGRLDRLILNESQLFYPANAIGCELSQLCPQMSQFWSRIVTATSAKPGKDSYFIMMK